MATAARIAPTSSCRARPIPRNPASTSTPRAGCRWPTAPSFPPGEAREDWAIVRALSDVLGKKLPYDSLAALRQAMFKAVPHLMRIDQIEAGKADDVKKLAGKGGSVEKAPFKTVEDFYLTNPIARASAMMAECSRLASGQMLTAAE